MMLGAPLFALACMVPTHLPSSAGQVTAEISDAAPVETAEADAYNLTATYEAGPANEAIRLVFDQQDPRNAYLLDVSRQRSRLLKVSEGRSRALASGPGLGAADADAAELTVMRRPGLARVCLGPRLLLQAHDSTFTGGKCGSAGGPDVRAPVDLFVQEIGPIHFEDDFFAGDERMDLWQALIGSFRVGIYWDPKQKLDDRPIGASWYENGGPGEHLAVAGDSFWDDYTGQVSVRPAPHSRVGLAFRVRDAENFGLLALDCAGDGQEALSRIIEVVAGEEHVLAERPGDWLPGEWHRLRVEVMDSRAAGFVNGGLVGESELDGYLWGRAGLYARTDGDCRFDDLAVHGVLKADPPARPQPHGPWTFPSGAWKTGKDALRCRSASVGVAVASIGAFADCDVRAAVRLQNEAEAGLLARWSGPAGYGFLARRDGDGLACSIVKVGDGGTAQVLATGPCEAQADRVELRLVADGLALRGFVDGECTVKTWDGTLATGDVGLVVLNGQAAFQEFEVASPPDRHSVSVLLADGTGLTRPGAQHGLFQRFLGDLWAPLGGKWQLTTLDDEPCLQLRAAALRYYASLPGDVALSADLLQSDGKPVTLAMCTDGQQSGTGYRLSVTPDQLTLRRDGQIVAAESPSAALELPARMMVARDGPYVVGSAGRNVLVFRDEQPLDCGYAVLAAEGAALLDNIELGADHTLAYRFDRVEPDWVGASGEWLFHSGMACIPWAYWLTGDGRAEPAFTWNRQLAPADLAVSFDVSEYTTGYESGAHEHYPYHDISLIVGAEEKHPDSGYRFAIGAEGGRHTRLYRQGQLAKQVDDARFTIAMGPHCNTPRAIEVFAVKHGGALSLSLNGVETLTYDDPEPLDSGYVGIGAAGCRANFRDLFLYRDCTWNEPVGVTQFPPR